MEAFNGVNFIAGKVDFPQIWKMNNGNFQWCSGLLDEKLGERVRTEKAAKKKQAWAVSLPMHGRRGGAINTCR